MREQFGLVLTLVSITATIRIISECSGMPALNSKLRLAHFIIETVSSIIDLLFPRLIVKVFKAYQVDNYEILKKTFVLSGSTSKSMLKQTGSAVIVVDDDEDEKVRLDMILKNSKLKYLFVKHLAREFCVENILFVEAVNEYKAGFDHDMSRDELRRQCNNIIKTFLKPNAVNEINVPAADMKATMDAVNCLFVTDDKVVSMDDACVVFDKLLEHVKVILVSDQIPKFKKSSVLKTLAME